MAKRDANKEALEQVEKATDSEPVKGKELLESGELKRQLSDAEERLRSGLSPKKASPSHAKLVPIARKSNKVKYD